MISVTIMTYYNWKSIFDSDFFKLGEMLHQSKLISNLFKNMKNCLVTSSLLIFLYAETKRFVFVKSKLFWTIRRLRCRQYRVALGLRYYLKDEMFLSKFYYLTLISFG